MAYMSWHLRRSLDTYVDGESTWHSDMTYRLPDSVLQADCGYRVFLTYLVDICKERFTRATFKKIEFGLSHPHSIIIQYDYPLPAYRGYNVPRYQ